MTRERDLRVSRAISRAARLPRGPSTGQPKRRGEAVTRALLLTGSGHVCRRGPNRGSSFLTLDGFRAAVLEVNDLEIARSYADKAMGAKGLAAEAVAALRLDYACLLLASSPSDARGVIQPVQGAVPPEPIAGEASLLLGMYYAATADWGRAIEVFQALERSRADDVGARAVIQHAAALEATGLTAEAIDEYLTLPSRFPDLPDLVAEGLFNAIRVALARGDDGPGRGARAGPAGPLRGQPLGRPSRPA